MEKIINLLKMNFCKKESMRKKSSLETYKSYTLNLEIINLSEVIKFMSPIVDINHFPFDYSWFPKKEEHIQESIKFLKENFMEEYIRRNPDKEISTLSIKKECRILKIYDHEFGKIIPCLFMNMNFMTQKIILLSLTIPLNLDMELYINPCILRNEKPAVETYKFSN